MKTWAQKESMAMIRLQDALEESIRTQTGSDTDEGDDVLPTSAVRHTHKSKLPCRLRGWLFLLRSGIKQKDWTPILQAISGSYDFKKFRRALTILFPDKILKECDNSNPPNK